MTRRLVQALLLGFGVGIIGFIASLSPFVLQFEENAGLDWLFTLRGPRPPPGDVVIVSIDADSSAALGLPDNPNDWPRAIHAELVQTLAAAGASVIAFDMFLDEPSSLEDDELFARAMREAGNVVLTARLKKDLFALPSGRGSAAGEAISLRVLSPVEPFPESALAVAPFPLPVVPMKVSQFWAFKTGAGDVPTLPVVVYQAHGLQAYDEIRSLLHEVRPDLAARLPADRNALLATQGLERFIRSLRELFVANRTVKEKMLERLAAQQPAQGRGRIDGILRGMVHLYSGPDSRYLNYYGPPRSIATIPYFEVFRRDPPPVSTGAPLDFRDKIVFVGFSERLQARQKDDYYYVFSEASGLNLGGVEIAATATANLLENRPVRPLARPAQLGGVLLWGILVGTACGLLPAAPCIAAALLSGTLYLAGAWYQFSSADLWVPLMVPLLLQTPLAMFSAILWQYLRSKEQRERIQAAFGHYIPPAVVKRLAEDSTTTHAGAEIMHGACMATDAAQYSRLAESMSPDELGRLMDRYYDVLFGQVEQHGGVVSDVVGDAMMAIWASAKPDPRVRQQACRAALGIAAAMSRTGPADYPRLPTRIGLHSGEIRLGDVGARHHFEYRAVGDIVSTASRLEGLNKQLGTSVLVSAETLAEVPGLLTRDLGGFLLPGKSTPVVVHELIGAGDGAGDGQGARLRLFAEALARFHERQWAAAGRLFRALLAAHGGDGPARFYAELCEQYAAQGPDSYENGAIRIAAK